MSVVDTSIDTLKDTTAAARTSTPSSLSPAWLEEDDERDLDAVFAKESADSAKAQQKLEVVRRNHAYGRQIRLALWMMVFLVMAMTSAQSWNPN
jgi:hypothetical protein